MPYVSVTAYLLWLRTLASGASLRGAAALYLTLNRPDPFGLLLLQSPSLHLGDRQVLRDVTEA
jgi:enterochelin esterase-like enzyme